MTCTLKNSQPAIKGGKRAGRGLPREREREEGRGGKEGWAGVRGSGSIRIASVIWASSPQ